MWLCETRQALDDLKRFHDMDIRDLVEDLDARVPEWRQQRDLMVAKLQRHGAKGKCFSSRLCLHLVQFSKERA